MYYNHNIKKKGVSDNYLPNYHTRVLMRKINKPKFNVENIFVKCQRHFTNKFNGNYNLIKKNLIEKENYYQKKCEERNLASITECNSNKFFNSNQMISSYEYVYRSNSEYRNDIKKLAEGVCPLCDSIFGYRTLELDHILPKSEFCDFVLTPINIVPICTSCNNSKQEKFGSAEEGILNPYFHKYELKEMLQFKIKIINADLKVEVNIIDVHTFVNKFSASPNDANCLIDLYKKIKFHISLHKIDKTIKIRAEVCMNCTIKNIIEEFRFYKDGEEKFFKKLEAMKSNNKQKLINEEYVKNILIDEIIKHKDRSNIYRIIISKTEEVLNECSTDEYFDV